MKNESFDMPVVKKGQVLMSEPFMTDPNFKRTAILMCEHREDGSIGFIINRPLKMKINQLVSDFPEIDSEVFFGGPVSTDTIHYIHNVGDLVDNSVKISSGVYWGGNFDKLKFLIQTELVKGENLRFFIGYSGWSEGQLQDELNLGTWYIANMHANYLFKSQPDHLWQQITHNIGDNYTVIAQMPDPVCLN